MYDTVEEMDFPQFFPWIEIHIQCIGRRLHAPFVLTLIFVSYHFLTGPKKNLVIKRRNTYSPGRLLGIFLKYWGRGKCKIKIHRINQQHIAYTFVLLKTHFCSGRHKANGIKIHWINQHISYTVIFVLGDKKQVGLKYSGLCLNQPPWDQAKVAVLSGWLY